MSDSVSSADSSKRVVGDRNPLESRRSEDSSEPIWLPEKLADWDFRNVPVPLPCDSGLWEKVLFAVNGDGQHVGVLFERAMRMFLHDVIHQANIVEDRQAMEQAYANAR